MEPVRTSQVNELTFADFKELAKDDTLSAFQKIGFPDSYREGKEERIFEDITTKVHNLNRDAQTVLEIGPGCSGPALMMIEKCRRHRHRLILIDSAEMLDRLPNSAGIDKFAGRYPDQCAPLIEKYRRSVDAIICYSVLHYIFHETNLFDFVDQSLTLLADGGEMLIGDIPNVSKRKRFFSSANGRAFHQAFTGTNDSPDVVFNSVEPGKIDDSVLLGLLARVRAAGADAYLVPQPPDLPMANRREDILIRRP